MNEFEDEITRSIMKRDGYGKFAKGNQEGEKFLQGEGGRPPGVKNKKTIAANQFAKDALHINPETGEKMTYKELVYYISKKAYESARILQLLLEYYLVLRFINSVTNLFTQDLVLSEPLPIEILPKYVAVIANRST